MDKDDLGSLRDFYWSGEVVAKEFVTQEQKTPEALYSLTLHLGKH